MNVSRQYNETNFITGLRAVAILLVFLIHSGGGGLRDLGGDFVTLVDFGKYGVQMFFVISGFTIFYQFFERSYSFKSFFLVRLLRISIPYFPIIFLMFLYVSLGGEGTYWGRQFNAGDISIGNVFLHMSYLGAFDLKYQNTIIGVEWTLYVEVFFYCMLGYLIHKSFVKENYLNLLFWVSAWFAIPWFSINYYMPFEALLFHWMPFQYGWMFLMGGLAFLLRKDLGIRLSHNFSNLLSNIVILLCCCAFVGLLNVRQSYEFNERVVVLLIFMLVVFVRDSAFMSVLLTNRVMVFIGSISFSFYLIHFLILNLHFKGVSFVQGCAFLLRVELGVTSLFFANLCVTMIVSFFWYRFFEKYLYRKAKLYVNKRYTPMVEKQT